MRQLLLRSLLIALCLGSAQRAARARSAAEPEISLRSAAVRVTTEGAPGYVERALSDLREQIRAAQQPSDVSRGRTPVVEISLGGANVADLGEEGFSITASSEKVAVRAHRWRGVHYGVLELTRRLSESGDAISLPATLALRERPGFDLRAMYAHTAWVYNRPFALRRWELDDWKRYVDLLAYMKVNVLQIWNLVSIMPQPLSRGDREYLGMFREIVRYAKEERGFRAVWIGDAANNVALPATALIADREYYVVHSLKDPGDPAQLQDIAAARRPLYELVPNADGYWVIDSDPGNWPGSPSQDFVKVLAENRKLINEFTNEKSDAELIYWIWHGWGTKTKTEDLTAIVEDLTEGAGGRFTLLACFADDLPIIERFNLMPRTTWFPYGAIEGEPSSPYTATRFPEIRKAFDVPRRSPQLRGVMGNAQTPLVQIPNLWFFHRKAWNASYDQPSEAETLRDVARSVFPRMAGEIARGWELLAQSDHRAARITADKLEQAARKNQLGAPGVIGRFIAPDDRWLVTNLAAQLRQHAEALELIDSLSSARKASAEKVRARSEQYFKSALKMLNVTGFRPALDKKGKNLLPFFNWFYPAADYRRIRTAWEAFEKQRPHDASEIYRHMKRNYGGVDSTMSSEMVEFLVGRPPQRAPDFKYAN